jgi:uncharacterized membrane protein
VHRASGTENGRPHGRFAGVDLARALAIIGMMMAHVGPMYGDSLAERLFALPHGRASILFMLVAGVSVSLLAGARSDKPAALAGQLLWRAALLLPAGLALQTIAGARLVILQTYALMFVLAIGLARLSNRLLLILAGIGAVLGPVAFLYGRIQAPQVFSRFGIEWGQSVGEILHALVLSGPYPLITWIVPFALGIRLGRMDLGDQRVCNRLVLAGIASAAVVAVVAAGAQAWLGEPGYEATWAQLMSMAPHSQMPLWLAGATALAVATLGISLMLVQLAERGLWPLIATGQVALTFYVLHIVTLGLWPQALQSDDVGEALWICGPMTAVTLAAAVLWRALFRRGPLEMLLQPPWLARERLRSLRR